jgi:phosphoglucomutase
MIDLRADAPKEFAGKKVLAVRDYKKGTRVSAEGETKLEQPATNALYYELEGDAWICIRPSGTEPKVKVYVLTSAETQADCDAKVAKYAAWADTLKG